MMLERPHSSQLGPQPNVTINMGSSTLNVSFPGKSKTCITKEAAQRPRQCLKELHSNEPFSIKIEPGSAVHARKAADGASGWHPPECQIHGTAPETTRCYTPQPRTLHVPPEGLVISLGNDGDSRPNAPQVLVTSSSGQGCSLGAGNSTQLIIKGGEGCKIVNSGGTDNQLIIQSDSGCNLSAPSLVISRGGSAGCKLASGSCATQLVIDNSGCRLAPPSPTKVVFGSNGSEGTELVFSGAESGCALARGQPTRVMIQTPSGAGCKLAGSCKPKATRSRPTSPSHPVGDVKNHRSYDKSCCSATTGTNGVKVQVAGRPGMQVSIESPDAGRSCHAAKSDFHGHTEPSVARGGGQAHSAKNKLDMHHNKPTISFLIASRMTQLLKEMKKNAEIRANTHPYYHS